MVTTAQTGLPLDLRDGIKLPQPARSSGQRAWRPGRLSPASHRGSDGGNGEGRSGTGKSGYSCNSSRCPFLPRTVTVASRRDGDARGQFFPLAGRGEAIEVHQRDTVDHGVADLHDSDQAPQSALVDLVLAQQLGVIEEIPQEPAQLPHRLGRAVETADDGASCKRLGFEDGEPEQVKALLGLPAMLRSLEADEKYAVRNLGVRITRGVGESGNMTFHPATSWLWGA